MDNTNQNTAEPEYTYDEIRNFNPAPVQQSLDTEETDVEEKKELPEENQPVEEKPTPEPVVEEKTQPPPAVEQTLNEQKVAEMVKKATEDAIKTYVASQSPQTTGQQKSAAQEFMDKMKEQGKTPSWQDAFDFLEQRAEKKYFEIQESEKKKAEEARMAEEKATKEREEAQQKANDEAIKRFNEIIDSQLNELYEDKKLTPIKDKNNPNDQGVMERKALFEAMLKVNNDRLAQGKPPIQSIKEVYAFHYTRPTAKKVSGSDAPVSIARGTPAKDDSEEIDYREISSTPFRNFFKKR